MKMVFIQMAIKRLTDISFICDVLFLVHIYRSIREQLSARFAAIGTQNTERLNEVERLTAAEE